MDPLERESLELTAQQLDVVELLKSVETEKFPLSDWYAGAIFVTKQTHNPDRFPQASHSLREILEKLPRVIVRSGAQIATPDFQGMRNSMHKQMHAHKDRFVGGWEGKKIDSGLSGTLGEIDKYLELSQIPSFKDQIDSTMNTVDPMVGVLDAEIRKEKIEQFHKLRKAVQGFSHHSSAVNRDSFLEQLALFESLVIDLLSSTIARDQKIIKMAVENPSPSADERRRIIELIKRRGANSNYFFAMVSDPIWLDDLLAGNVIKNPSKITPTGDGYITMPSWPPADYLRKICNQNPRKIVEIILGLEKTDNPNVLRDFFEIAADIEDPHVGVNLLPLIRQFLNSPPHLIFGVGELIVKVFQKWSAHPGAPRNTVIELLKETIGFQPDPREGLKKSEFSDNPEVLDVLIEASPKFEDWDYEQILNDAVPAIAEHDPFAVAKILINAIANMNKLEYRGKEVEQGEIDDGSEIWCPNLSIPDSQYQSSKATLVQTLTRVCERIYKRNPELIPALDGALRGQRWKVFSRLRNYLYSLHPNDGTREWICDEIMNYEGFSSRRYGYEFQLMLRKACEVLGNRLLDQKQMNAIVESILIGPPVGEFQKWVAYWGEVFTDEKFRRWQQNFHYMQLRPFVSLLADEQRKYFDELQNNAGVEHVNDDDYMRFKSSTGGFIGHKSPKSVKDFIALSDAEILDFINEWDEERKHETELFVEINISALADTFGNFFKNNVFNDASRLAFWVNNYKLITRPVYTRKILDAVKENTKEGNFENIEIWIELCSWILAQPDTPREEGAPSPAESSKDYPDWSGARRSVVDFIEVCVRGAAPIEAREEIAALIKTINDLPDANLDNRKTVSGGSRDLIFEAVNSTRSRSIEALHHYGFWIRNNNPEDPLPEVENILLQRTGKNARIPLTPPEYAILGMLFGGFRVLSPNWADQARPIIFPQDNFDVWKESFCSYISYTQPTLQGFRFLRGEFDFALENITALAEEKEKDIEIIHRLGRLLFLFYLHGEYPLQGNESLLQKFYSSTEGARQHWAGLFEFAGRCIRDTDAEEIDEGRINKFIDFFDWRFSVGNPDEMTRFTFWLHGTAIDAKWRLEAYSKILDISGMSSSGTSIELDALNMILPDHLDLVMECVMKKTRIIRNTPRSYVSKEKILPILRAGLKAENSEIKNNAKQASENLLASGAIISADLE